MASQANVANSDITDDQPGDKSTAAAKSSSFKRIIPRTLLSRSLLIIVTPLVLLQVVSTWVFYDRHYDTITKRLSQGLAGDIAVVIELIQRDSGDVQRARAFRLARRSFALEIELEKGAFLPGDAKSPSYGVLNRKLSEALEDRFGYPFVIDTVSLEERVKIDVQLPDGVLRVLVPRKRLFSSTTYIFIMWMVGTSVILFGVAVFFMRKQVTPIQRLAQAAESFGKGRDVEGFKPEGAAEVRQASAAFLQMRSRIKRQVQQRTDMLSGVSHDLRTPLTRMKLQLAMFDQSGEVEDLKSDVTEMERMIEGYLAFARGEGTEQPQSTEIMTLLREVVTQTSRDGGIIDLHTEQDVVLPLRREATRRCFANLLVNAQRYGKHVSVRAGQRDQAVEITVDDDGPGIPPERRKDVFKPFFRLDQSRNQATGGIGLGLTIARDVIHSHGGELSLDDAPGGGLRARVRLPL
ncbi:ATP-binding protein [Pelagibius sp. Alg239-R121]|uniref:ATP-binding protein n=1 Tax=Pelagibius sp. Alg239-R121 TaxID=2993448 RepID=UPI0024A70959|nr:ATP-binding protein [Pelagibius sp. Alg239-R121]